MRRRANRKVDRRIFRNTAKGTRSVNLGKGPIPRGGIRL